MQRADVTPLALADHVRGAGTPMLLLHGGSGSHRHWSRVVAPLAALFEVHAPDLPGYGESPDVPAGTDGERYVAIAAASLETLVPRSPVDMVGFSFGAVLAAAVARRWGARVRRLTLLGPGGFGLPEGRELATRRRRDMRDSVEATRALARHNLAAMMIAEPSAIDEAAVDQQLWNIAHARFNSLLLSYQDRLVADIAALHCPVQVVWGARDVLAHPSIAARRQRIAQARPDVAFGVVADAGHWVQYERPDDVVRWLADFHARDRALTETS
jgi:2-hydroxy-6-oxonona-2,4-dienedioate hydrolase